MTFDCEMSWHFDSSPFVSALNCGNTASFPPRSSLSILFFFCKSRIERPTLKRRSKRKPTATATISVTPIGCASGVVLLFSGVVVVVFVVLVARADAAIGDLIQKKTLSIDFDVHLFEGCL